MTAGRRLLLVGGWVLLVLGPLVGALLVGAEDATAIAYGNTPPSRALGALEGAVPAWIVAGVLFLVVTGRVRRADGRLAPPDEALVGASQLAGWALAAVGAVLVLAAMIFGGPPGIIGGFALVIVTFSLLGRKLRR